MSPPVPTKMIALCVNGRDVRVDAGEQTSLMHFLRNDCELNSPKYGCGYGECGACSVLINGIPARSCIIPLRSIDGRKIITLEGLAENGQPGIVQQAFVDTQAAQCGYCLSGVIINAHFILGSGANLSVPEIKQKMSGCLCRCGTHNEIVKAILLARERLDTHARASVNMQSMESE